MKGCLRIVRVDRFQQTVTLVQTNNLVVSKGYENIMRLLAGDDMTKQHVNRIAFGTGTDAPVPTDTHLQSPITPIKTIGAVSYPSDTSVLFTSYLLANEGNGFSISEAGLYARNDNLVSRAVFDSQTKTADYQFTFHWTIQM